MGLLERDKSMLRVAGGFLWSFLAGIMLRTGAPAFAQYQSRSIPQYKRRIDSASVEATRKQDRATCEKLSRFAKQSKNISDGNWFFGLLWSGCEVNTIDERVTNREVGQNLDLRLHALRAPLRCFHSGIRTDMK
jgi:hypothetical protein